MDDVTTYDRQYAGSDTLAVVSRMCWLQGSRELLDLSL